MLPSRNRSPLPGPATGTTASPGAHRPSTRLIASSPGRALVARWNQERDAFEIVKVYESGTLEEARREYDLGRRLADLPGIVQTHGAEIDARRARPCVIMDFHAGCNIEAWLAEFGAADARAGAAAGRELARTLRALHDRGYVHRDVKPSNVYLADDNAPHPARSRVLLIDLEHTIRTDGTTTPRSGFTGGTHGFAPPEAYAGTQPATTFDAFGFGATLHALVTGRRPFRGRNPEQVIRAVRHDWRDRDALLGLPREITDLIERCLGPAERRPSLATIEDSLSAYLATVPAADEVAFDRAIACLHAADPQAARDALRSASHGDAARRAAIEQRVERTERLLQRLPPLPAADAWSDLDDERVLASTIQRESPRLRAFLDRFPRHRPALELRARLGREVQALLRRVPLRIPDLKRAGRFDIATELLEHTLAAVEAAEYLPNSAPRTESGSRSSLPGALLRDPHRYLRSALDTVRSDAAMYRELLSRLEQAEARLDLDETARILDSAADRYSGSNEIVAGLKDRQLRLRFYLKRLAWPQNSIDDLAQQLHIAQLEVDLQPLAEVQERCRSFADHGAGTADSETSLGLRSLRRLLHDVRDEFPHLDELVADAADTLDRAMVALTERAWWMLEDAHNRLDAVPVPIRPLQSLVNRLDALRLLEVFVDQDDRSRAELLDDLERVRLQVDQARAARDGIARGAQEAIDRGHLTTAVYDMKRAVERFASEDVSEDASGDVGGDASGDLNADANGDGSTSREDGTRELRRQLEQAQRRKQQLDDAAARNMELASQFAELHNRPDTSPDDEHQLLIQRQECLRYLIDNVHAERSELYRGDLRDVQARILHAHSIRAEHALDAQTELEDRVRVAATALAHLEQLVHEQTEGDPTSAEPILHQWRSRVNALRGALETERSDRELAATGRRRRGRLRAAALVGSLLVASFVVWQARHAFAADDAPARLRGALQRITASDPQRVPAIAGALLDAAPRLTDYPSVDGLAASARGLADSARRFTEDPADPLAFAAGFGAGLRQFRRTLEAFEAELGDHVDGPAIVLRLERFATHLADDVTHLAANRLTDDADRARFRDSLADR